MAQKNQGSLVGLEEKKKKQLHYWVFRICDNLALMAATGLIFMAYLWHQEMYIRWEDPLNNYEDKFTQISLAKAFVLIAEGNNHLQFAGELNDQIFDLQAALMKSPLASNSTETAIHDMAVLLLEARQRHYDIGATIMTLKASIRYLEFQMNYESRVTKGSPPYLYCLGLRLLKYKFNMTSRLEQLDTASESAPSLHYSYYYNYKERLYELNRTWFYQLAFRNDRLHHFCILSDDILRTSTVVNSTMSHYNNNHRIVVFHIITTETNYEQMRSWIFMNYFDMAMFDIKKSEALFGNKRGRLERGYHDRYKLDYLIFLLPDIFPELIKVVFLDDNIVVQKDLSPLYYLNMKGKVNGAVENCNHTYSHYLDFSHPLLNTKLNPNACAWEFGLNIFDLYEWRKRNLTRTYRSWEKRSREERLFNKDGRLPYGLLVFHGLVIPLDPMWDDLLSEPPLRVNEGMHKFSSLYVNYSQPLLKKCCVQ